MESEENKDLNQDKLKGKSESFEIVNSKYTKLNSKQNKGKILDDDGMGLTLDV